MVRPGTASNSEFKFFWGGSASGKAAHYLVVADLPPLDHVFVRRIFFITY